MKKLLSIMLALVLILSMSTVAFAATSDDGIWDGKYEATKETTFNEIVKTYTSENNVVVNETLSFTSTASTSNPDYALNDDGVNTGANLTVDDLTIDATNFNNGAYLNVTIPSLSKAGTYEWTIKENEGNTAGVTYSTDEVHVIVLVEYDNANHALKIANTSSYIKGVKTEGSTEVVKKDYFTNTFKSGEFTVAKDVDGNMANENDEFEITVTLTSTKPIGTDVLFGGLRHTPDEWTEENGTWTIQHTGTYSEKSGTTAFNYIPVGVTVTVKENTSTEMMNGYTQESIKMNGSDFTSKVIADDNTQENAAIVVKNTKNSEIITGIALDSMPYFLMLAVACMGLVVFFMKKRSTREY